MSSASHIEWYHINNYNKWKWFHWDFTELKHSSQTTTGIWWQRMKGLLKPSNSSRVWFPSEWERQVDRARKDEWRSKESGKKWLEWHLTRSGHKTTNQSMMTSHKILMTSKWLLHQNMGIGGDLSFVVNGKEAQMLMAESWKQPQVPLIPINHKPHTICDPCTHHGLQSTQTMMHTHMLVLVV